MDKQLFFLTHWPRSRAERWWIRLKVILKEGVLHGHWDLVFRLGQAFGNLTITDTLKRSLEKTGLTLLDHRARPAQALDAVVFRDIRNLQWALRAKRKGTVSRIFAGPFLATLPFEGHGVLQDPAIDGLIFLSEWHRDLFVSQAAAKLPPTHIWFAGVDTDFWQPPSQAIRDRVLVFIKQIGPAQLNHVLSVLTDRGLAFELIRYGEYEKIGYRDQLARAQFTIFLHETETQGLATFESWSMGCPTLHWNPGVMRFLGKSYEGASSSPYLTDELGRAFKTWDEFPAALEQMLGLAPQLFPRKVMLEKYTLAKSADRFYEILQQT